MLSIIRGCFAFIKCITKSNLTLCESTNFSGLVSAKLLSRDESREVLAATSSYELVSRGQTAFSPHGAYRRIISACSEKGSGTFTDHELFQSHQVPGGVK